MKKLILIALACSLSTVYAKNDGETRTVNVKVDVSGSDVINIQAKRTELMIETWDKNEVAIEATFRYDGEMTPKIQEFLEQFEELVNNNISKGGGEVSINTRLVPSDIFMKVERKFWGFVKEITSLDAKLTYKIKAPGANKYVITNSYKDVRLVGSFDKLELTQYSGYLEAGIIKSAKMNLKYGSANIERLEIANLKIYEENLNVNDIGTLTINAKHSDLEVKEVDEIDAVSYESDFKIGSISKLEGSFKYSEIDIKGKLDQSELTLYEVDIEAKEIGVIRLWYSKYNKFDIDKVGSIVFEGSYEDITRIGTVESFKSRNSRYGNHSIGILQGSFQLNAYEDKLQIDEIGSNATEVSIDGKYIDCSMDVGSSAFILIANVKYGKVKYNKSDVEIKRYIKDNDQLEIEVHSKTNNNNPVRISVKGYEVDMTLD